MRRKILLLLAIASLALSYAGKRETAFLARAQTESEHAHDHAGHSDHDHGADDHHEDHANTAQSNQEDMDVITAATPRPEEDHAGMEPSHEGMDNRGGEEALQENHESDEPGKRHEHANGSDAAAVQAGMREDNPHPGHATDAEHGHADHQGKNEHRNDHRHPASSTPTGAWSWSALDVRDSSSCTWTRERLRSRMTLVREERMTLSTSWQSYRRWILGWIEQMEDAGAQAGATQEALRNADRTATAALNALSQREQALQILGKWACTPGDILQAARTGSRETVKTVHQARKDHVHAMNALVLAMLGATTAAMAQ